MTDRIDINRDGISNTERIIRPFIRRTPMVKIDATISGSGSTIP